MGWRKVGSALHVIQRRHAMGLARPISPGCGDNRGGRELRDGNVVGMATTENSPPRGVFSRHPSHGRALTTFIDTSPVKASCLTSSQRRLLRHKRHQGIDQCGKEQSHQYQHDLQYPFSPHDALLQTSRGTLCMRFSGKPIPREC
jgi:hypothetical protein